MQGIQEALNKLGIAFILNQFYFTSIDATFQDYVDVAMINKIKIYLSIFLEVYYNLILF